ncbi:hypothetical protein [Sediminitomix flava]|uniref:Outer membrane protein with beta-barrel domain n=1 Tax=Sediminitomix flava TaxID=379075 RepID=A0A315ZB52_SEDFL|nr:hypothetical protein [Sediminitomix flava]PWJ42805.1 hypothetical protein BC781_102351 [Sediminitomix flava]
MKLRYKVIFAFLFMPFASQQLMAQEEVVEQDSVQATLEISEDTKAFIEAEGLESKDSYLNQRIGEPQVQVEMGTSVGSMWGGGTFTNNYVAPTVGLEVSPRMSVDISVGYSYNTMNGFAPYYPFEVEGQEVSNNMQGHTIATRVGVNYKVNERLDVSAHVFYAQNQMNSGAPYRDGNMKGFDVSMQYKVNDNITIGGRFMYAEGNGMMPGYGYGMYGRPYGMYGGFGGFGGSPFNNRFGGGYGFGSPFFPY